MSICPFCGIALDADGCGPGLDREGVRTFHSQPSCCYSTITAVRIQLAAAQLALAESEAKFVRASNALLILNEENNSLNAECNELAKILKVKREERL